MLLLSEMFDAVRIVKYSNLAQYFILCKSMQTKVIMQIFYALIAYLSPAFGATMSQPPLLAVLFKTSLIKRELG